jgi:hypothetical protein
LEDKRLGLLLHVKIGGAICKKSLEELSHLFYL